MNRQLRMATRILLDRNLKSWRFHAACGMDWAQTDEKALMAILRQLHSGLGDKTIPVVIADNIEEYLDECKLANLPEPNISDMVCLKLPYSQVFVEWASTPSRLSLGDDDAGSFAPTYSAAYLREYPIGDVPRHIGDCVGTTSGRPAPLAALADRGAASWLRIGIMAFKLEGQQNLPPNSLIYATAEGYVAINELGAPVVFGAVSPSFHNQVVSPENTQQLIAETFGAAYTALYAINALHCKNVAHQDASPQFAPPEKWARRQRIPQVTYKTLHIGGMRNIVANPQPRTLEELAEAAKRINPLHTVRGHFKRFTAEKPLMGRHVGVYWWEPQMRGSKAAGEVIKDYSVDPPEEEPHDSKTDPGLPAV